MYLDCHVSYRLYRRSISFGLSRGFFQRTPATSLLHWCDQNKNENFPEVNLYASVISFSAQFHVRPEVSMQMTICQDVVNRENGYYKSSLIFKFQVITMVLHFESEGSQSRTTKAQNAYITVIYCKEVCLPSQPRRPFIYYRQHTTYSNPTS